MNFKGLIAIARTKKRRLFRVTAVPHVFTFANACFGFFSIICVLEGNIQSAACALLFSIVADILDGLCARTLHISSLFGAELDSLADAISFCLSPAILAYSIFSTDSSPLLIVLLSGYVCSGLFRLARFTAAQQRAKYFIGLPSPAAALIISNLILYKQWFMSHHLELLFSFEGIAIIISILSLLMCSRIPFPCFKYYDVNRYQVLLYSFLLIEIIVIGIAYKLPIFLLIVFAYISSACLLYTLVVARRMITLIF